MRFNVGIIDKIAFYIDRYNTINTSHFVLIDSEEENPPLLILVQVYHIYIVVILVMVSQIRNVTYWSLVETTYIHWWNTKSLVDHIYTTSGT